LRNLTDEAVLAARPLVYLIHQRKAGLLHLNRGDSSWSWNAVAATTRGYAADRKKRREKPRRLEIDDCKSSVRAKGVPKAAVRLGRPRDVMVHAAQKGGVTTSRSRSAS
jgi:hypothetical protein